MNELMAFANKITSHLLNAVFDSHRLDPGTHPDAQDDTVKARRPGLPKGLWGRRRINKVFLN